MGKGELWPPAKQKPLNRSSPITKQNLGAIRSGVSSPHIRRIYTPCSRVYYPLTVKLYQQLHDQKPVSIDAKLPTLDDVIKADFTAANELWKETAHEKVVSRYSAALSLLSFEGFGAI